MQHSLEAPPVFAMVIGGSKGSVLRLAIAKCMEGHHDVLGPHSWRSRWCGSPMDLRGCFGQWAGYKQSHYSSTCAAGLDLRFSPWDHPSTLPLSGEGTGLPPWTAKGK